MNKYAVIKITQFNDFESEEEFDIVSDLFDNKQDAVSYMKNNFNKNQYIGSWSTINIAEINGTEQRRLNYYEIFQNNE